MPTKDGASPQQGSLFGEILDWMLAPLLLIWPISVALTWLVAQGIASRPYDRELGEMARSLGQQVAAESAPAKGRDRYALAPEAAALLRADASDTVFYQVLGLRGELLSGDATLPVPAEDAPVAPWELHFRDDEVGTEAVRVAYLWVTPENAPAGEAKTMFVQVAETLGKRARLTNEIIKGVILPQFVILPLAVLLVWLALARGISPLNELQRRIRSRESSDLSPIDEQRVPDEVAPLVQAINDLLARLDSSMSRQKHFLADAAHQLKTPLAGLRTQAELVQREIDAGRSSPDELKRSLAQIARASERAAHMVNQLLSMARAEDAEQALKREPLDLAAIAIDTVRDFVPRALERRIDLGYDGVVPDESRLRVKGQPVLLGELIRNLVDNALLYTPAGGLVTVRVVEDPFGQVVVLQVEDSGPGIAPGERDKVFQPFYRSLGSGVEGSGLGLAIVKEIVQQHEAELTLDDARVRRAAGGESPDGQGPGARFTIRFPATLATTS
jgi:two-component system, OmpR family, sensor histidine kinase TctE